MMDGIYSVRFSREDIDDFGTVVIEGSRVIGGDTAYYYTGRFEGDSSIEGSIKVRRHPHGKEVPSIFSPLTDLTLHVSGTSHPTGFNVTASVEGSSEFRATIEGHRSSDINQ